MCLPDVATAGLQSSQILRVGEQALACSSCQRCRLPAAASIQGITVWARLPQHPAAGRWRRLCPDRSALEAAALLLSVEAPRMASSLPQLPVEQSRMQRFI